MLSLLRFSVCDQCFTLKMDLASPSLSLEQKVAAAQLYRDHIRDQFQDRSTLWSLQALSGDAGADQLTLLLDGMDQGKFMIPRGPLLRSTASLCAVLVSTVVLVSTAETATYPDE